MTITFCCVEAIGDNFAGIADDNTVARDIEIDIRIWSNQHIVAYRHFSDDNSNLLCFA